MCVKKNMTCELYIHKRVHVNIANDQTVLDSRGSPVELMDQSVEARQTGVKSSNQAAGFDMSSVTYRFAYHKHTIVLWAFKARVASLHAKNKNKIWKRRGHKAETENEQLLAPCCVVLAFICLHDCFHKEHWIHCVAINETWNTVHFCLIFMFNICEERQKKPLDVFKKIIIYYNI